MGRKIILMVVFIFVAIFTVSFWSSTFGYYGVMKPWARDYQLTGTLVDIGIQNDGTINVHEDIGYDFKGCFREVYRELDINRNVYYYGPYIDTITARCEPDCMIDDRSYEIAGNFGQICDKPARFNIDFSVLNGIAKGKDVAEFHYKIWGERWEKPLKGLQGTITLPGEPANVYFNPAGIADYEIEGNQVTFSTGRFKGYLEVRVLMPPDAFASDAHVIRNDDLTKGLIIEIQEDYQKSYDRKRLFAPMLLFGGFFALAVFSFFLFQKYGKEPRIGYNGMYEREPVKGIKPYTINSLVMGRTGDTDDNAITATIMDLIRRKHISTEQAKGVFGKLKDDIVLIFRRNPKDELSKPEELLFRFFSGFGERLVWSEFIVKLGTQGAANKYIKFTQDFEKSVDEDYDIKEYFSSKGNVIFKSICGFAAVYALLLFFMFLSWNDGNFPFLPKYAKLSIVMMIAPIVCLFLPNRVFGKFSEKGYEIYQKSMNFRKFMMDMTLLKQYPPESIVIWEEQLVYATAFGVADKVIENMKLVVNPDMASQSSLHPFYAGTLISSMAGSRGLAHSTIAQANSSRGGHGGGHSFGGGGIGGGFGGGGGGAR